MEKLLTKTPIASCFVFTVFIILFGLLVNNYKVTVYEPLYVETIEIDMEKNILSLKHSNLNEIQKNTEIQLIYSTQEQVLKGTVLNIDKKNAILTVKFEHLKKITQKQITDSKFQYAYGTKPIGRDLKLWD